MGTTPIFFPSPLSPKSLVVPLMLASYLGSHSQVLESGVKRQDDSIASNPKTKTLFLYFTTTSNSNKDEWNVFEVPSVWVHEEQSDREEQCRIAKQQSRGDEFSRIGATFVG